MDFPPLGNSDHVIVSDSIDFPPNPKRDSLIHHFRDVPWEDIFKISASAAARGWNQYICLIVSIRSSLTHFHGFQLLVLLPYFIEITIFVGTNRVNLLNPKKSSGRLVIVPKGFFRLPNLHTLI